MATTQHASKATPKLIVVMGTAGSGKSTVGGAVAEQLGLRFLEGDDFHSDEARQRMASGKPLDCAMRAPWIARICKRLTELCGQNEDVVLAFSGLKKAYREPVRQTGYQTLFIFLYGEKELIRERMEKRKGHYMPAGLVDSQYEALEIPQTEETDVCQLDVSKPLPELIAQAIEAAEKFRTSTN